MLRQDGIQKYIFSQAEEDSIEDRVVSLKDLKLATDIFEANKYVSISVIYPCFKFFCLGQKPTCGLQLRRIIPTKRIPFFNAG